MREALAQPISTAATYMEAVAADPDKKEDPPSTSCTDAPKSDQPPSLIYPWPDFPNKASYWASDISKQHGDVKLLGWLGRPDPGVLVTEEGSLYPHLQSVLLLRVKLVFKSGVAGFQPLSYTRRKVPGGAFLCDVVEYLKLSLFIYMLNHN